MQQRQKAVPTLPKTPAPTTFKSIKRAPLLLDEKAMRQIAGGVTDSPHGSW